MIEGLAWPPAKEDLERLYLVDGLSAMKIANAYGLRYKSPKVAESTILYHLKRNGIRRRDAAEHVRKVTERMVDDWVWRYQAGESLNQIAGESVNPVTVWNHLRRRGMALRNKVEAQIRAVTKYERHPFNGDAIEKAYLMGLRYGDLHVVRHGRAIRVRVSTTHPAMAELFESLFSPYAHVSRYPRRAKLVDYEWTLECDLDNSFGFLLTRPTKEDLDTLTPAQFDAFLAGFFDAEGTIYMHRKRYGAIFEVSISNTDLIVLDFIEEGLWRQGYHPRQNHRIQNESRLGYLKPGKISILRLSIQSEVCRLLSSMRLKHPEKIAKSAFVVHRVCSDGFGIGQDEIGDWERSILQVRENRDEFVNQASKRVRKHRGRSVKGEH